MRAAFKKAALKTMHSGLWYVALSIKIQTIKVGKGSKLSKTSSTEVTCFVIYFIYKEVCMQNGIFTKLHLDPFPLNSRNQIN